MNEYKNVKIALRKFLMERLALNGNQVFRAPPEATSVNEFPAIIIRSATALKEDVGATQNSYRLLLGLVTRAETAEAASDELDDLLKSLDNAIATYGVKGLDSTLANGGRWVQFTRLGQETVFDNPINELSWIVYGATAGVLVVEVTSQTQG